MLQNRKDKDGMMMVKPRVISFGRTRACRRHVHYYGELDEMGTEIGAEIGSSVSQKDRDAKTRLNLEQNLGKFPPTFRFIHHRNLQSSIRLTGISNAIRFS